MKFHISLALKANFDSLQAFVLLLILCNHYLLKYLVLDAVLSDLFHHHLLKMLLKISVAKKNVIYIYKTNNKKILELKLIKHNLK